MKKITNLTADHKCMSECVSSFEKLSRHHCELYDSDSVARGQGEHARTRVLQWLVSFIQDHKFL